MTKMFIMPWNGLDATLHLCLLFSVRKTVPAFAPNSDTFKRLKKNNWKKLDWGSKVTTFSKNVYKLATSSAWEKAFLLLQMLSAQSFLKWTNKTTIYKWTDLFAANQHSCYGVAFILGVRILTGLYQIRSTFLTFGKPSQMTESDKIDQPSCCD